MNLEELANSLADSGIVEESTIVAARDEPPAAATAEELVQRLVRSKSLTKFQAQRVLAGEIDSLVIGDGDFVLQKELGSGGFGQVWLAWQPRLKRQVALKSLQVHRADSAAVEKRLLQEGQVLAQLEHPNLVRMFDARFIDGVIYLVMQYIKGVDSQRFVASREPLTLPQAYKILFHTAKGLHHAHERGIIHRDVKPSNVMVGEDSVIRVLDLGLARIADESTLPEEGLTQVGEIAGSPQYMAPEQFDHFTDADARSDVYGLGCLFFFLLTGRTPYEGKTVREIRAAHYNSPIPSFGDSRPELPPEVDTFFSRMVAKDPAERIHSMGAVLKAIDQLQKRTMSIQTPTRKTGDAATRPASPRGDTPAKNFAGIEVIAPPPPTIAMKQPPSWGKRLALLTVWICAGAGTWFIVQTLLNIGQPGVGDKIAAADADPSNAVRGAAKKSKTRFAAVNPKNTGEKNFPVKSRKDSAKRKPAVKKQPPGKQLIWRKAGYVFRGTAVANGAVAKEVVLEIVRAPKDGKGTRIRVRSALNPLMLVTLEGDLSDKGGPLNCIGTLRRGGAHRVVAKLIGHGYERHAEIFPDKAGNLVFKRNRVECKLKRDADSTLPTATELEKMTASIAGSQWMGLAESENDPAKRIVLEFTSIKFGGKEIRARMYSVDYPAVLSTVEGRWDPVTASLEMRGTGNSSFGGGGSLRFIDTIFSTCWFVFTGKNKVVGSHRSAFASLDRKSITWKSGKMITAAPLNPVKQFDPKSLAGTRWTANAINGDGKVIFLRIQIGDVNFNGKQVFLGLRSPTGTEVYEGKWNAQKQAFEMGSPTKTTGKRITNALHGLLLIPQGVGLLGRRGQTRFWAAPYTPPTRKKRSK